MLTLKQHDQTLPDDGIDISTDLLLVSDNVNFTSVRTHASRTSTFPKDLTPETEEKVYIFTRWTDERLAFSALNQPTAQAAQVWDSERWAATLELRAHWLSIGEARLPTRGSPLPMCISTAEDWCYKALSASFCSPCVDLVVLIVLIVFLFLCTRSSGAITEPAKRKNNLKWPVCQTCAIWSARCLPRSRPKLNWRILCQNCHKIWELSDGFLRGSSSQARSINRSSIAAYAEIWSVF